MYIKFYLKTKMVFKLDFDYENRGNKKHKCQFCEKLFSCNYDLKRHQLIHTGERLYECDHCKKTER